MCPGTSKIATSIQAELKPAMVVLVRLFEVKFVSFVSFIDHLFELISHFTITNPALHFHTLVVVYNECEEHLGW